MSFIDWFVMLGTLFFIVGYGAWKTRGSRDIRGYLLGDNSSRWWTIGLSVMATQASAITFLSTPGQAYVDGMRFLQFYMGLPIAMIIISVVFIPLYYKLKVYTAYEFLESRFDRKTRVLTALLFLLQRGLATGITIYAPAIILSQILGWTLDFTVVFIGVSVVIYTVSGGTNAVNQTHKQQMTVIFVGMIIAFGILLWRLSEYASFTETIQIAGKMGKMNIIDLKFDLSSRYNIWSGLIGGLFLQLSYFGTDQSQVQRYLSGQSIKESRLGLMFNGLAKIPMQFFILLTGVLVFVFYQFNTEPVNFNQAALEKVRNSGKAEELVRLEARYDAISLEKKKEIGNLLASIRVEDNSATTESQKVIQNKIEEGGKVRQQAKLLIHSIAPDTDVKDTDYIFISFVMNFLPKGIVGLLLAVILSAAMSSTSAELNALASTSTVDIYKRNFKRKAPEGHYLWVSKVFTIFFGAVAILFAMLASLFENLIQAVNILGSLFYGTILGVFIAAFFVKFIRATAVFTGALLAEAAVICIYILDRKEILQIEYLWLNLIGCILVIFFGCFFQLLRGATPPRQQDGSIPT